MTTVMTRSAGRPAAAQPTGVSLRPAGRADAAALHAMFRRCGRQTRYDRFHGLLHALPEPYLAEALAGDPALHDALVVEVVDGAGASSLVALGSVRRLDGTTVPRAELGVLVEDAWQHRNLGGFLLTTLAARAASRGVGELCCDVLASRRPLIDALDRSLGPVAVRREGFTLHARVRLPAGPGGAAPALGWRAP